MFMHLKSLFGGKRRAGVVVRPLRQDGGVFSDDASLADRVLPIYILFICFVVFGGFTLLIALELMGRI